MRRWKKGKILVLLICIFSITLSFHHFYLAKYNLETVAKMYGFQPLDKTQCIGPDLPSSFYDCLLPGNISPEGNLWRNGNYESLYQLPEDDLVDFLLFKEQQYALRKTRIQNNCLRSKTPGIHISHNASKFGWENCISESLFIMVPHSFFSFLSI